MKIASSLAAVLALSACSKSSTGVSATDVATYQRATLDASTAVSTYEGATQAMATPAACQAAAQQYATQMGDALQAMHAIASGMDDHMRSMGQMVAADMTCGADVMSQRLQQHLAVACSSGDMARNQAIAAEHCLEMAADADHLQMRAAAMRAMVGDAGMMGGGMMSSGDMSAAMSSMMDGGYTAPDGQHMSWGDPMPGCALSGGSST